MDSKKKCAMTLKYMNELYEGFIFVQNVTEDVHIAKVTRDMATKAERLCAKLSVVSELSPKLSQQVDEFLDICDIVLRLTVPSYVVTGNHTYQHFPTRICADTYAILQENRGDRNIKVRETRIVIDVALKSWDVEKNREMQQYWLI